MKRIFFLDAGRKYFGVPAIRSILESMAASGFDQLQLYFSDNQGFRFALEDMTVQTEYGIYDLTPALGDGYCQEDKTPDGSNRFLTQADMEQILQYAGGQGIELIPALNMPGHMGAILEHFPHLRYPGSRSSIDLRSPEAVAFARALADKYIAYFAGKGCRYFNFCGDEFANDLGTMGLDCIYRDGTMRAFVSFVNGLAGLIRARGLIPMAFNDGIYYNNDLQTYGPMDTSIRVCYWISGWNGYSPASAKTLETAGFKLINANHRHYCGAGETDWPGRVRNAAEFDCTDFDGTFIARPAGAMLCLWCDRANADGPDEGVHLARRMQPVIAAFGRACTASKEV